MKSVKEKSLKSFEVAQASFNISNKFAAPRLVKVVISTGIGSINDKKKRELIVDRITKIAGQKSSLKPAKKSIATFKSRKGDPAGVLATLRGKKMYAFLDKLINIAIPRMRDFKGISLSAIDEMGNVTIGVREHTIFPEVGDEELRDVFGLAVTIVTTADTKDEAVVFLRSIGLPLKEK